MLETCIRQNQITKKNKNKEEEDIDSHLWNQKSKILSDCGLSRWWIPKLQEEEDCGLNSKKLNLLLKNQQEEDCLQWNQTGLVLKRQSKHKLRQR